METILEYEGFCEEYENDLYSRTQGCRKKQFQLMN